MAGQGAYPALDEGKQLRAGLGAGLHHALKLGLENWRRFDELVQHFLDAGGDRGGTGLRKAEAKRQKGVGGLRELGLGLPQCGKGASFGRGAEWDKIPGCCAARRQCPRRRSL